MLRFRRDFTESTEPEPSQFAPSISEWKLKEGPQVSQEIVKEYNQALDTWEGGKHRLRRLDTVGGGGNYQEVLGSAELIESMNKASATLMEGAFLIGREKHAEFLEKWEAIHTERYAQVRGELMSKLCNSEYYEVYRQTEEWKLAMKQFREEYPSAASASLKYRKDLQKAWRRTYDASARFRSAFGPDTFSTMKDQLNSALRKDDPGTIAQRLTDAMKEWQQVTQSDFNSAKPTRELGTVSGFGTLSRPLSEQKLKAGEVISEATVEGYNQARNTWKEGESRLDQFREVEGGGNYQEVLDKAELIESMNKASATLMRGTFLIGREVHTSFIGDKKAHGTEGFGEVHKQVGARLMWDLRNPEYHRVYEQTEVWKSAMERFRDKYLSAAPNLLKDQKALQQTWEQIYAETKADTELKSRLDALTTVKDNLWISLTLSREASYMKMGERLTEAIDEWQRVTQSDTNKMLTRKEVWESDQWLYHNQSAGRIEVVSQVSQEMIEEYNQALDTWAAGKSSIGILGTAEGEGNYQKVLGSAELIESMNKASATLMEGTFLVGQERYLRFLNMWGSKDNNSHKQVREELMGKLCESKYYEVYQKTEAWKLAMKLFREEYPSAISDLSEYRKEWQEAWKDIYSASERYTSALRLDAFSTAKDQLSFALEGSDSKTIKQSLMQAIDKWYRVTQSDSDSAKPARESESSWFDRPLSEHKLKARQSASDAMVEEYNQARNTWQEGESRLDQFREVEGGGNYQEVLDKAELIESMNKASATLMEGTFLIGRKLYTDSMPHNDDTKEHEKVRARLMWDLRNPKYHRVYEQTEVWKLAMERFRDQYLSATPSLLKDQKALQKEWERIYAESESDTELKSRLDAFTKVKGNLYHFLNRVSYERIGEHLTKVINEWRRVTQSGTSTEPFKA